MYKLELSNRKRRNSSAGILHCSCFSFNDDQLRNLRVEISLTAVLLAPEMKKN